MKDLFKIGTIIILLILAVAAKTQIGIQANRLESKAGVSQANGETADFLAMSEATQSANMLITAIIAIGFLALLWVIAQTWVKFAREAIENKKEQSSPEENPTPPEQ